MLTLNQKIVIKSDVLVQDLGDHMVLLNLNNEKYYGLDEIGSVMWSVLQQSSSLQLAYENLLEKYDVDSDTLKQDFLELVQKWIENDLVEVANS